MMQQKIFCKKQEKRKKVQYEQKNATKNHSNDLRNISWNYDWNNDMQGDTGKKYEFEWGRRKRNIKTRNI